MTLSNVELDWEIEEKASFDLGWSYITKRNPGFILIILTILLPVIFLL